MEISGRELAKACEISEAGLRKWTYEGLPKLKRGTFDLGAALSWVRRNRPLRGAEAGIVEERRRKLAAEARLKELDLMLREGTLIPRESVLQEFLNRIAVVKQGLLTLPMTLPGKLSGQDPRQWGGIIKRTVFDLLTKYSRASGPLIKK